MWQSDALGSVQDMLGRSGRTERQDERGSVVHRPGPPPEPMSSQPKGVNLHRAMGRGLAPVLPEAIIHTEKAPDNSFRYSSAYRHSCNLLHLNLNANILFLHNSHFAALGSLGSFEWILGLAPCTAPCTVTQRHTQSVTYKVW